MMNKVIKKEDVYHADWEIRLEACIKFGFRKENFKDENEIIRLNAYLQLGFTEESVNDSYGWVRFNAYQYFGFTKESRKDGAYYVEAEANLYFDECRKIFNWKKPKYKFTEDEANLLKMNGFRVNVLSIIDF